MIKFSDKLVPKNQYKKWDRENKKRNSSKFWTKNRDCPSKNGTVGKYGEGTIIMEVWGILTDNLSNKIYLMSSSVLTRLLIIAIPFQKQTQLTGCHGKHHKFDQGASSLVYLVNTHAGNGKTILSVV